MFPPNGTSGLTYLNDDLPQIPGLAIQDSDQLLAAMRTMAEALIGYYKELTSRGFTPEQALTICIGWQASMLGNKT